MTTSKELPDMPMPAIHGVTRPTMASGRATKLYANDHHRFWRMTRSARRAKR